MKHKCHARGCKVSVPPKMLMCLKHWRMVPKSLQRGVWLHYRPGQEIDKKPTTDYLDAADEAIKAVFYKEHPVKHRHILAIDPATKLGWARRVPRVSITSGIYKLKGMEFERVQSYMNWLWSLDIPEHSIVVYETPHQMPGRASAFRVGCHLQAAMWYVLSGIDGITLLGVPAPSLKYHATGNGRAGKPEVIKAMRLRWGRRKKIKNGWWKSTLTDDNEADALALLSYGIQWERDNQVLKIGQITR